MCILQQRKHIRDYSDKTTYYVYIYKKTKINSYFDKNSFTYLHKITTNSIKPGLLLDILQIQSF